MLLFVLNASGYYELASTFNVLTVGERSNLKKIPTHMQDHGDA